MLRISIFIFSFFSIFACQPDDQDPVNAGTLQLINLRVGTQNISFEQENTNLPLDRPIVGTFSAALDTSIISQAVLLFDENDDQVILNFNWLENNRTFSATTEAGLEAGSSHRLEITENLKGELGESFSGISVLFTTILPPLRITELTVDGQDLLGTQRIQNISLLPQFILKTDQEIDPASLENENVIRLVSASNQRAEISWELDEEQKIIIIKAEEELIDISRYVLTIDNRLLGIQGQSVALTSKAFFTDFSDEPKFEIIPEEDLLTLIQEQTFKYFWDFAHPVSGLSRERNSSGDLVTIGGSGFGLMAWIVGAERGFITRDQAVDKFETALKFLAEADRYHGVWPHWMNGITGSTLPFSQFDDGADLVETAFMIQALLTWKQYLRPEISREMTMISLIDQLYVEVEWDWFTRGGQNVLFWHWSPNHEWQMNLRIQGWNESLIIYFLAAASPTHPIDAPVYHEGWARNGSMINGNSYYDITLPLGEARGGPLFYAHYSFLGLDPRGLSDDYANYMEQNRNHTLINRAYAAANPLGFVGHSEKLWGFTAGDNPSGYSAHSPTNDVGTIQPTAAISSIPYTPEESMEAIKTFYYKLGDRLWGEYGFYDGIDITRGWVANSYLAIDQGPIILMIENHKSGFLWDLFMANPEVQTAMDKLNFSKTN